MKDRDGLAGIVKFIKESYETLDNVYSLDIGISEEGLDEIFYELATITEENIFSLLSYNFEGNNGNEFDKLIKEIGKRLCNENEFLKAGQFMRDMGLYKEAIEILKRENNKELAYLNIGITYELMGKQKHADFYYSASDLFFEDKLKSRSKNKFYS